MGSYIKVKSGITNSYNTYLIDTGATISTLKINKLSPNVEIERYNTCKISGISDGLVSTFGSVKSDIFIDNVALSHKFHIIDKNFPIPCDGILGLDFLKKFRCFIDYGNEWRLVIRPLNCRHIFIKIFESPEDGCLTLPARCEVIRRIVLVNAENDVLVHNQEIADGIFVGRTIVSRDSPFVRVVNTTTETVTLQNVKLNVENIDNFNVYDPTQYTAVDRPEVLRKLQKNFPSFVYDPLTKLCSGYLDVFALETDRISYNNFYKQKLRLHDDTPVYIKNYRLPKTQKDIINKKVDIMLKNNTISPSISEYNSPILLVPKKPLPGSSEKRFRFVVDYRHLNKKLLADKYPLPRMDDILDQLGKARFFSIVDLLNGFYQIELDEESKNLTSFSTDKGSFQFNSIPFGLKIGPNSFQRMITLAFSGLSPLNYFIYLDDLILIASTEKRMYENLEDVFKICRKYNLKLNPDKCQFFLKEVTYLGHKCTENGILPDESKFDVITHYPRPTDADSARRFVAFCNYYRRFIPHFTHYSYHLTRLTKKGVQFYWSDECETAFNYLKNSLITPPILKYPDFDKPFCITTDASKIACGAVLSQNYDGIEMPIAYASRSFTSGERNKSTPEQELCAIHFALQYFKPYIYGLKFLVKTDHRPLVYLYTMKNPSSKLLRIRLDLEEYDFEIEHIPGKNNVSADALSRIDFQEIRELGNNISVIRKMTTRSDTKKYKTSINDDNIDKDHGIKYKEMTNNVGMHAFEIFNFNEVKSLPRLMFKLRHGTPCCVVKQKNKLIVKLNLLDYIVNEILDLNQVFSRLEEEADNIFKHRLQLCLSDELFTYTNVNQVKAVANKVLKKLTIALTPSVTYVQDSKEKLSLIEKFHNDPIFGGHCGVRRLYHKLRLKYFWNDMLKDIISYVKKCIKCQENKSKPMSKEQLAFTPTPQTAFDVVLVDTIGPLVKSNKGNTYAVTLICDLTKYLVTIPLPDKKAVNIAKAIFENFVLVFGPMKELLSDRGSEYVNSILDHLCQLLNIERKTSTSYHHRTLGTVERSHRTLNEYLRSYVNDGRTDWDDWLAYFTYCYNTTPSVAIKDYCPYQLIFGKTPNIYEFLNSGMIDPVYNVEDYHSEVKYRLQLAHQRSRKYLNDAKTQRKIFYDNTARPQHINVGDLVLMKIHERQKLDPLFKGPYEVKSTDNYNVTLIDQNNKLHLVHKDNVKHFIKYFYYRFE